MLIQRLTVKPEWRGQGLSHKLMNCLYEFSKNQSSATEKVNFCMGTWVELVPAMALYKKHGFKLLYTCYHFSMVFGLIDITNYILFKTLEV